MIQPTNKWDLGRVIRDTLRAAGEKNAVMHNMSDGYIIQRGFNQTIDVLKEDRLVTFTIDYWDRRKAQKAMNDLLLNIPLRYNGTTITFSADGIRDVREKLKTFLAVDKPKECYK